MAWPVAPGLLGRLASHRMMEQMHASEESMDAASTDPQGTLGLNTEFHAPTKGGLYLQASDLFKRGHFLLCSGGKTLGGISVSLLLAWPPQDQWAPFSTPRVGTETQECFQLSLV